jgi:hypothetical protein
MAIADFNVADFDRTQQQQQDEKLLVKFYIKSVKDVQRSKEEGRDIFKEKEYIDIRIPGSRDGAARPATFRDKQRFPRHYAAFQQRVEMAEEGTPLSEWPVISRTLADEMAFFNIKTVEQLANVNDTIAGQFMGAQMYKQKAKAWLERAKEDVTVDKLQSELAQRDDLLKELQDQIARLTARLDEE